MPTASAFTEWPVIARWLSPGIAVFRAANRAAEGRSIIALQSTNREHTRSRIVAKLADGVVTTPRAEADLVVTEHGIAELRGRTLAERARALIAIADPGFRAELERASEPLV